jgi:UDP-glucose 4-epimerase
VKILVTGGSGFIGSHTVELLLNQGYKVINADNLKTGSIVNPKAFFYKVNICSPQLVKVFEIEKPQYVIHLAAQISVQQSISNPYMDAENNVLGTINILQKCVDFKVKKIVYASSAAVYGEPQQNEIDEMHSTLPLSFYGLSKLVSEYYIQLYAKRYGINYTILRYSNVYGMGQGVNGEGGVITKFIGCLQQNLAPIIYGDGKQTRDFIFVKDVATANMAALHNGDYATLNISCGFPTTINQLFKKIVAIYEKNVYPLYQPGRTGDIRHSVLNNRQAKSILNWEPVYNLYEGLTHTVQSAKRIHFEKTFN